MKPDPINVGVIGYGFSGRTFHVPLIMSIKGLHLRAVASSKAGAIGSELPGTMVYETPTRLIADPDIDLVVIATPNDTHAPLARQALIAGKNVVIDKPFALDLTEARELVSLADERDLLLSVFQNRRWDSDFLTIQKALEEQTVGRVAHFESHFDRFRPDVRDRWRERAVPGSGVWFDLGPHLIDQALQLFGVPDTVQLDLAMQRSGALADDWAHAVLAYGDRRIVLHASMLTVGGTSRFKVHGDRGSIVKRHADRQEEQLLAGLRPGAEGWGVDDDPLTVISPNGETRNMAAVAGDQRRYYADIKNALTEGAKNPVSPIEALMVMGVLEAGILSAPSGSKVKPPVSASELNRWLDVHQGL